MERPSAARPRRTRPGRLLAAVVLPAAAALAACGTGTAGPSSTGGQRSTGGRGATPTAASLVSRPQAARHAAAAMLGEVVLPPGARTVGHEPAGDGGLLSGPFEAPANPNLADITRFALVPGGPMAALAWVKAHPPRGSAFSAAGSSGSLSTGVDVKYVAFSWPAVGQLFDTRTVAVAATSVPGGMSAVRVDALVTWLPAKPTGDVVPAGVKLMTAVMSAGDNPGQQGHPLTTVTSPAVITAVVSRLDHLAVATPGATSCPADFGQSLTLRFYAAASDPPLAVVNADDGGCQSVQVVEHGGTTTPGLAGDGFVPFVEAQLGWHEPAA